MKAIVLHQPYATLVALGVKTIETRSSPPNGPMRPGGVRGLPGLAIQFGERIAIVAGARCPEYGATVGDWVVLGGAGQPELTYWPDYPEDPDAADFPYHLGLPANAALGAVVCTVVVAEALPMVVPAWEPAARDSICLPDDEDGSPLTIGRWTHPGPAGFWSHYDSDQLPYGDFAPGRWGWLLTDVKPCDPIPCKGRQGVFELPAEATEALSC